ncbi:MAG TPA: hypothetical protein QGG47_08440 [Acidobacteriota bacterium]|nr:hypothetical protein [Acidobacteriota bacterium]
MNDLQRHIDTLEESYEFMLAYAAQGLEGDQGSKSGGQLREFLQRSVTALTALPGVAAAHAPSANDTATEAYADFMTVLESDARSSRAAIQLVLSQQTISSQLVDNLNASIHLRAMLTDLFLLDELLKLSAE